MDAKAEKKLAKQKAREEMLMKIKKETLERERAMDEATLKKIKDKWFDSLVETKVPQMQDNLKHILHYMEKLIESENFRKLLFESERQDLEEDATLLAQSQSSALETLLDIYEKRVQDLHNAYNDIVSTKKKEAEDEFNKIEEAETNTEEAMQTMLYQMNENRDKQEDVMNCSMFLKLDDERSKHTEIKENLRSRLEKKMEKRWGEISATLNKYEHNTRDRRKEYMMLKAKDDADSRIINQQMKKTQKLFVQLEELKNCMDECYAPRETISLIRDTREERTKFFNTFKRLKFILQDELYMDKNNLKNLSVITDKVTTDMKALCKKGEQILTMYRVCLRLETEEEKVLPVGGMNLPKAAGVQETKRRLKAKAVDREEQQQQQQQQDYQQEHYLDEPRENSITEIEKWAKGIAVMEKFWRKVGKVRLSKLALNTCIKKMQKENKLLKQILTSYLNEVSEKERKFP